MGTELTEQQEKALDLQKLTNRREKAAEAQAVQAAQAAQAWEQFLHYHTGLRGVQSGHVFYDCIANRNALTEWVEAKGFIFDQAALECAFEECRERLAQPPTQPYVCRVDLDKSHVMPQLKSFAPPPLTLPFTKQEILGWSTARLRKEVSKSPRHLQAINTILKSQQ